MRTLLRILKYYAFNRTIEELKSLEKNKVDEAAASFNRTIEELKFEELEQVKQKDMDF